MANLVPISIQREGLPKRRPSNVCAVAYLKIRGDATATILLLLQSIDITSLSRIAYNREIITQHPTAKIIAQDAGFVKLATL